jgi:hypothetical protein
MKPVTDNSERTDAATEAQFASRRLVPGRFCCESW